MFAGCEDFGIALAEAQAYGTPLIAFGRGGATDIVQPLGVTGDPTGVLFHEQSVDAVTDAVEFFEARREAIDAFACHENAARFGPQRFAREIAAAFAATMAMHTRGMLPEDRTFTEMAAE